jgi:hypothetical protein
MCQDDGVEAVTEGLSVEQGFAVGLDIAKKVDHQSSRVRE